VNAYGQQIKAEVESWDGVSTQPHRFGGTEFNLGKVEIGHVHGSHLVDIPFTRKVREALVAEGEAQPHHILPASGWISFYLRQDDDVQQALRLFRLSYLSKRARRLKDAGLDVYDGLALSDRLRAALGSRDMVEDDTE
jgi:hypothetical protein